MKITHLETIVLSYDERPTTRQQPGNWLVVKVHTDEGIVGISRGSPPLVPIIQEYLVPQLVGEDPVNVERLWQKMYQLTYSHTRPPLELIPAIGVVDVALWDILGKVAGLPIYRLMGGFQDRAWAYADAGMHFPDVEELVEHVEDYTRQGFRVVKIHLLGAGWHDTPESALEKVRACREVLGPEILLGVDVHKMWDPRTAIEVARQMEQYDVHWLEEPVHWDDQAEGYALLAAGTRIMITAGESERTIYGCRELLARGGVKIMQADTITIGGFTPIRKVAALAAAYHAKIAPHGASYPEITSQAVAALPNGYFVSTFAPTESYQIWTRLYQEPPRLEGSWIMLSQKPGLGLELDEDFIAAHRVEG